MEVNNDFMLYKSGIFKSNNCGDDLNHMVLVIGYFNQGKDFESYFVGKNSWGEDWGEDGFFRVEIGEGRGGCGIANDDSVFPVLFD